MTTKVSMPSILMVSYIWNEADRRLLCCNGRVVLFAYDLTDVPRPFPPGFAAEVISRDISKYIKALRSHGRILIDHDALIGSARESLDRTLKDIENYMK